jgi:hypothetical protein
MKPIQFEEQKKKTLNICEAELMSLKQTVRTKILETCTGE